MGKDENGNIKLAKDGLTKIAIPGQLDSKNPQIEKVDDWEKLFYAVNQLDDKIKG